MDRRRIYLGLLMKLRIWNGILVIGQRKRRKRRQRRLKTTKSSKSYGRRNAERQKPVSSGMKREL